MPTKKELSAALLSSKSLDEGPIVGATASMKKHLELTNLLRSSPMRKRFSPSEYMLEMGMSTEDRLEGRAKNQPPPQIIEFLDMSATSHAKESAVEIGRPLFHAMPTEIIFQKYKPQENYKFPLILRNSDRFARHVKVVQEESPYFSLQTPNHPGGKVAPGMEVVYNVVFTPDSAEDYTHELICITEREKFVVPVRAIGARGVVDFPDKVHFPTAPVKYTSTKTVLIRNVGTAIAHISLEANEPFSISPSNVSLEVGVCVQVDINFTPKKIGDHTGELVVHYETGEEVCVELYGGAIDVNVRLDRNTVKMENTYITLSSQRSVVIYNRSDVIVHYQWKAFSSEHEEQAEKDMRSAQLTAEESIAKEALLEECLKDPGYRDRLSILGRTFDHRKQYVDDDKFLFSDDVMIIEPLEGDIWPNSQAEVSVIFRPEEAASYSKIVYCDLTGRETRLPLKMKGDALGPKLQFSFDTLDIQNVFVESSHSYEVVLENKGEVEAAYSLVLPNSLFGPKFQFTPDEGLLQPGELQAIEISFQSSVLGEFCEEFVWNVNRATEPLKLTIQGRVIGPTFRFNVPLLDFKVISYGFVSSKEIMILNTSEIPLKYSLRVPSDNLHKGASTSQSNVVGGGSEEQDPTSGPEFVIRPRKGTLPPSCSKVIQVDFTPYQVKVYDEVMVVDIKGVGANVFSLPIHAE
jgi:hydrocephalus-inducing protein